MHNPCYKRYKPGLMQRILIFLSMPIRILSSLHFQLFIIESEEAIIYFQFSIFNSITLIKTENSSHSTFWWLIF